VRGRVRWLHQVGLRRRSLGQGSAFLRIMPGIDGSKHTFSLALITAAKASLNSQIATSSFFIPALSKANGTAFAGATGKSTGSIAASALPQILASTRLPVPYSLAIAAFPRTSALAPSFNVDELAREFGAGSRVLARICGSADAAIDPVDFPVAPAKAVPLALERAGIKKEDVAIWEFNEAFAAVIKANEKV